MGEELRKGRAIPEGASCQGHRPIHQYRGKQTPPTSHLPPGNAASPLAGRERISSQGLSFLSNCLCLSGPLQEPQSKRKVPLPKRHSVPFSLQQFFLDVITPLAPQPESKSYTQPCTQSPSSASPGGMCQCHLPKTDSSHLFFARGPV